MLCAKAAEQLQLYIDKRLPLDKMRTLEAHLAHCQICQHDLFLFEEIEQTFRSMELVAEPADLTVNIMQRVARHPQVRKAHHDNTYALFRPSLVELLSVILLATITTLGIILEQPSLRSVLPIANGHDTLSLMCIYAWNMLMSINSNTLLLACWIIGTILGVWITLILAGSEMRTEWYKAMMSLLPVR